MEVVIDAERFFTRIDRIQQHWQANKGEEWSNADAICIPMGAAKDNEVVYTKSSAMHLYLLGYEFSDSILVILKSKIYFMATEKKIAYFQNVIDINKIPLKVLTKTKVDIENRSKFREIINAIKSSGSTIGIPLKGEYPGSFIQAWNEELASAGLTTVDISRGLGVILAMKDETEQDICRRAAVLSNKVMKHGFIEDMENIIDKDQKITHEAFATKVEDVLYNPTKLGIKAQPETIDSCYFPIIQSGGVYDIKPSAKSDNNQLKFDIIMCSLGARYKSYCSNIVRTFLIDPNKYISKVYTLLINLYDKCIEKMLVGNELKIVYETAQSFLSSQDPTLLPYLPKTFGFGIGLEYKDSTFTLNATNNLRFVPGMVFAFTIGFHNVPLQDKLRHSSMDKFSLLIGDTILIQGNNMIPDIMTKCSKALTDISYNIADKGSEDGDDDNNENYEDENAMDVEGGVNVRRSTRSKEEKAASESAAAQRASRQAELMEKKIVEARKRLTTGKGTDAISPADLAQDLDTYKSTDLYPKDLAYNKIKIDLDNEAILVPINGIHVPFHITTIKNVSMPEADKAAYLRINFYTPGQALGKDVPKNIQYLINKYNVNTSFIKELTFRSLDVKSLTNAYRNILELRKRIKQRELKEEIERDLVVQAKLQRIRDERIPRLQDLVMRPTISGKKSNGTLEAHMNGLRFTTNKGEILDVMYANIKHALFQPCQNKSTSVIIHFNLKDNIMIGKKKYKDVQFYTEVIEASLNLDNNKRNNYDIDELDEEQRERELKKKINSAFKEFNKKVEKIAKHYEFNLEFDIPYIDLGFDGTCNKEMVFIMPSVRCLVNLTEIPFFVIDLSEVEHVHFERVDFATRNFDMTFIFYNHEILPRTIASIEMRNYEMIQEWLSDVAITYTFGAKSMTWKNVMEAVREDEHFYDSTDENGEPKEKSAIGWRILGAESDSEGDNEDEDDGDEEFSSVDEEEESESEDSDESSFEDEDEDEDEYTDEDDLSEDGKDWDELEKDAARDDEDKRKKRMLHGDEDDEDDYHSKKKSKKNKK